MSDDRYPIFKCVQSPSYVLYVQYFYTIKNARERERYRRHLLGLVRVLWIRKLRIEYIYLSIRRCVSKRGCRKTKPFLHLISQRRWTRLSGLLLTRIDNLLALARSLARSLSLSATHGEFSRTFLSNALDINYTDIFTRTDH